MVDADTFISWSGAPGMLPFCFSVLPTHILDTALLRFAPSLLFTTVLFLLTPYSCTVGLCCSAPTFFSSSSVPLPLLFRYTVRHMGVMFYTTSPRLSFHHPHIIPRDFAIGLVCERWWRCEPRSYDVSMRIPNLSRHSAV